MTTTPPPPELQPDLERLFAEEPFVRSLARSLVADEADDVVQQTWLRALEHRSPAAVQKPRQWLAKIVRNLATDRRRRDQRRSARERLAAKAPHVPSSAEFLEGEEVRRALVLAVDRLPTDLRTVVLLRYYDGLPPRTIAAQLDLPVTTVWNRLHAGLAALRQRLDRQHGGDRRAWLVPLVPFATSPRSLPFRETLTPGTTFGVLAMTTKAKIVTAVAVVLALWVAWAAWPDDTTPTPTDTDTAAAKKADPASGQVPVHGDEPLANPTDRVAIAPPPAPAAADTGSLVVSVRYADEPQVAVGLTVLVFPRGDDARRHGRRAVTDADGYARFDGLPSGEVRARCTTLPRAVANVTIVAGEVAECTLLLDDGITLTGIVTDSGGTPIANAAIETVLAAIGGVDAEQVATSAKDGTFAIRHCPRLVLVGARALGYAASPLHFFYGASGGTEHVHIELRHAGGSVQGEVLDADGEPVAGAVVRIGEGKTQGVRSTPQGAEPLPAQVRTNDQGRFTAIGIPTGTQPLKVRSLVHAPWLGTCEVLAGGTSQVVVRLQPGVACRGTARAETGEPAVAVVTVHEDDDFLSSRTQTQRDGTFVLTGLPVGEFEVRAERQRLGKARAVLFGVAGQTVECELTLSNGIALTGNVLDADGLGVPHAGLRCDTADGEWHKASFTDPAGGFLIPECPLGSRIRVEVQKTDFVTKVVDAVDPLAGAIEIRLERDTAPRGEIRGRLLRPDGSGAVGVTIEAFCYEPQRYAATKVKAADGTFSFAAAPGRWALRIQDGKHPQLTAGPQVMAAADAWDVGTLQLVRGGTVVVQNGSDAELTYRIVSRDETFSAALYTPVPPMRSELLPPGDYLLLVQGQDHAAQRLPFSIRAEEETRLDVQPTRGVRQKLVFELAGPGKLPFSIYFNIRRGDELLVRHWARDRDGQQMRGEACLAPGEYTITTRDREPVASASFTVPATEGAPVRIELR